MEPITTTVLVIALANGLVQVGGKLVEKGVDAALEPAQARLKKWVQTRFRKAEDDKKLHKLVTDALAQAGAPVADEDALQNYFLQTGLAHLQTEKATALREQVARAVIGFTDASAPPPPDLMIALGWPPERAGDLARLLAAIRAGLAGHDDYQALIAYADEAQERHLLQGILDKLAQLDALLITTPAGSGLRVYLEQRQMTAEEAAHIEAAYRADLIRAYKKHEFRGLSQTKRDTRTDLADIYMVLGLLGVRDSDEHRKLQEDMLALDEAGRLRAEEKRMEHRVTDVLADAQRLVILGQPGAGKTISLRFIALMLAYGYGAARLGLFTPYVPILVRVADYARQLETHPNLALDKFLIETIEQEYTSAPRLGEFLRHALGEGACMVLLDGLDEVDTDPLNGKSLHTKVADKVRKFADVWCSDRPNRLILTSRIEGYWNAPLPDFTHVQLSPLRPPEEVEAFLLRWYTAHEHAHDPDLPPDVVNARARDRVGGLLPGIMQWPSVRRLATNPLLLTILAFIYENVGRLPNRRIKLYEIAAQTLIESWRQAQTGLSDDLLAELGEDTIIRIMAPLAYWLHEARPGGTAPFEEWETRLQKILCEEEGYDAKNAHELIRRFLHHARHQTGLLAERGLGQLGFFHLTFEEYLAARYIASKRTDDQKKMLKDHWHDPRWQEVILLAAGQLGIIQNSEYINDYLSDIVLIQAENREQFGRPAVLAGRALADIGERVVKRNVARLIKRHLRETMQDIDPDTDRPSPAPKIPLLTRADAADIWDELGEVPDDLYQFVEISKPTNETTNLSPFALAKYPVTNLQYQRFLEADDYADPALWQGFPKFDEKSQPMAGDWGEAGLEWQKNLPSYRTRETSGLFFPEYWRDPRFGVTRKGVPVVGVSWYEANAYCRWVARHWGELEEGRGNPALKPTMLRLPTDEEWTLAAGGETPEKRYPWDKAGETTRDEKVILARANVSESGISRTTPVGMYPLGVSSTGVCDMGGNVWEWQANFRSGTSGSLALRGGSWYFVTVYARVSARIASSPNLSNNNIGFRVLVVLPR